MLCDLDSLERDEARAELRELCTSAMRCGYDVTADLPDFAEVAFRAMTSAMSDVTAAAFDLGPGAADVAAQMVVDITSKNMVPTYIEDRTQIPRMPAPPPQRSYMEPPPRIRDSLSG